GRGEFNVSAEGDVVIKIAEGEMFIHVTKPEKKEKAPANGAEDEDASDDDEEEDSDEEEEETREKKWNIKTVLGEARLQGVKNGEKVEVTINAQADGSLNVAARVVNTQNGVRGVIKAPAA